MSRELQTGGDDDEASRISTGLRTCPTLRTARACPCAQYIVRGYQLVCEHLEPGVTAVASVDCIEGPSHGPTRVRTGR
jgi:hypothetical protein